MREEIIMMKFRAELLDRLARMWEDLMRLDWIASGGVSECYLGDLREDAKEKEQMILETRDAELEEVENELDHFWAWWVDRYAHIDDDEEG